MILQALYELAEREDLAGDPDYEWKPVAWLVEVDRTGRLLNISGTHVLEEDGGNRKPRPKSFPIPRQSVRTSGDRAHFLVDKAEYVFGIDPAEKRAETKLDLRLGLFRSSVEACAKVTGDEGAQAVARMLRALAQGEQTVELPNDCAPNDLFAFVFSPDRDRLVTDRPAVKAYWRAQREGDEPTEVRCLVTGEQCNPGSLHVPVKPLPGATSSGVPLVSFNSSAFESYGLSGNDNAPVSREAAEACGTALNRLLHPQWPDPHQPGQTLARRHTIVSDDTVICYWSAERTGDDFATALNGLLQANPDQVAALYQSIWRGQPAPHLEGGAFYALTLSGSQGRAIVRDWLESTVDRVQRNLAQHFADLTIARNTPKPRKGKLPPQVPLRPMLRALAVRGEDRRLPKSLAAQFIRSGFEGTSYPIGILSRAVERARAEMSRDTWNDLERRDARAALIKAVLNRRRRFSTDARLRYQEVSKTMDPNNTNPGYVLGRLMAVIERIQEDAMGRVNATVVDRFFAGASAAPRTAFVRLDKNALHHVRKLRDSSPEKAYFYKRLLDELHTPFEASEGGYPAYLSVEDQGMFVLGYHQMRHWLWMSKDERSAWREEQKSPSKDAQDTTTPDDVSFEGESR